MNNYRNISIDGKRSWLADIMAQSDFKGTDLGCYAWPEAYVDVAIARLQYHEAGDADECLGRIAPKRGDRVDLIREPDNYYDSNAIKVMWRNGQHQLGYIPRQLAEHLAPIMDSGCIVTAFITTDTIEPWKMLLILFSSRFSVMPPKPASVNIHTTTAINPC